MSVDFEDIFRDLKNSMLTGGPPKPQEEEVTSEQLLQLYKAYMERDTAVVLPGSLVQWKARMKNQSILDYGKAMVVLEYAVGRRRATTSETDGTPYEYELADVRVGYMCTPPKSREARFIGQWVDSHRLERFVEESKNDA